MFDPELYRDKTEVEKWKKECPIRKLTDRLTARGDLDAAGLQAIEADVAREIEQAIAFAEAGTLEPVEDLERDVYARAAHRDTKTKPKRARRVGAEIGVLREGG
jgi:TPP-dependent pyruvate/acetoin dehydrogenase alpha subunit